MPIPILHCNMAGTHNPSTSLRATWAHGGFDVGTHSLRVSLLHNTVMITSSECASKKMCSTHAMSIVPPSMFVVQTSSCQHLSLILPKIGAVCRLLLLLSCCGCLSVRPFALLAVLHCTAEHRGTCRMACHSVTWRGWSPACGVVFVRHTRCDSSHWQGVFSPGACLPIVVLF